MTVEWLNHNCLECGKRVISTSVKLGRGYVHEFGCFRKYWNKLKKLVPDIYVTSEY